MKIKQSLPFRLLALASFYVVLALVACAPAVTPVSTATSAPGESVQEKKDFTFCQINASLAEPWNVQMDEDIKTAAAQYPSEEFPDVTVTVQYKDSQGDTLRQRAQLEECVLAKVDAILLGPIEAGPMTEPVSLAMDAGIPVFLVGRNINGEKYTQYVGSDEFKLSYAQTQWIVEKYKGQNAKVVYLQGLMTSTPAQERYEGFLKAIEGSDVEVIFTADAKWDEAAARSEMESALARFSDIDVVIGANDPAAHGAYLAAKAAGRESEMIFVGIDGLKHEGQVYVQQGVLAMTIIDRTGGDIGLHNAVKYLLGQDIGPQSFYKKALLLDSNGQTEVDVPDSVKQK